MFRRILKFVYIQLKIKTNRKCRFGKRCVIDRRSIFRGHNSLGNYTGFCSSILGEYSYIGNESHFYRTKIGKFVSIGNNVRCAIGKHPTKDFVSTSPIFYSTQAKKIFGLELNCGKNFDEFICAEQDYYIVIGNDVWIGDNVLIMQGVHIGDGAIIGAGAVVTKDIPPYSINVGIPAKTIKYRFSQEDINMLMKTKWWDKGLDWIKANVGSFASIANYKKVIIDKESDL